MSFTYTIVATVATPAYSDFEQHQAILGIEVDMLIRSPIFTNLEAKVGKMAASSPIASGVLAMTAINIQPTKVGKTESSERTWDIATFSA